MTRDSGFACFVKRNGENKNTLFGLKRVFVCAYCCLDVGMVVGVLVGARGGDCGAGSG